MTTASPPDPAVLAEQRRQQLAALLREKARQTHAVFPASTAQRGVWFMQQMDPATHAYHVPFYVRVLSPFDSACAKSALQQLIDRHAMLRTTFRGEGQLVEMVVHGAGEAAFAETDASGCTEAELHARVEASLQQPFDLQQGPLVRLHLFHVSEKDHVFLLVLHHLICDGHAMGLVLHEFMEFYQAAHSGHAPRLYPRTMDYPDIVVKHEQWLAGPAGEKGKAYWLDRLSGEIPQLDLPATHPPLATGAPTSAVQTFEIDEPLYRALARLAQSCGVTLFSVLLASYQALLMRLTGQQDVLVGVPMAGRTQPGYEAVVGHFVNLVAIRGDGSGDPTFRDFLTRTWPCLQGAVEHQEFPFPDLVRLLRPTGRFERAPLFRTLLNILKPNADQPMTCMLSPRAAGMAWGPLRIAHYPIEALEEHYDLAVRMVEMSRHLEVKLQYDCALFDDETIWHFGRAFLELLQSATRDPDVPLSRLPILAADERTQLLETWNRTAADYPRETALPALLAEQAARAPDAVALVFGETRLTYGELHRRANRLARFLQAQGLGRDDLVAVAADRSPELVLGLLGVLQAGAAYVPVDPKYPADRIKLMLQDSGARLVLTTASCDEAIAASTGAARFCLDRDWAALDSYSGDDFPSPAGPLDLAYVIYTSGSTGRPRGVGIPHRALVNFLCSMRKEPGLTATDVLLSVTTFSFDIFGLELFLPLLVGARMELAGPDEVADGERLAQRLERCGATVMQATPVSWRMLLAAGFRSGRSLKALCGGEALPCDLAGQLLAAGVELWNMYGPTETTIWSCVEPVHAAPGRTVSIGRPIANTQAYVLDAHLQPVPVGVAGQLYLGGDGLARGYWQCPELTAAKFLPHPFVPGGEERIYHTGDLARFLPDGRLECLGRVDHQIKIRGFRIELEEIETTLLEHEGLTAAAAVARGERDGPQRLVAYIVSKNGAPSASALRDFLRVRLPDYMVPQEFVVLDALPLTPNGKIDRKSLPAPDESFLKADKVFVAPRNELELKLVKIWEGVFGRHDIGVKDDFFDLGGHSLLAVQLVTNIAATFHKKLPLSAILEARDIEHLAAMLRESGWSSSWYSLIPIQPRGSRPPLFAVHDLHYQDLAKHLGPDQPIYGLRYGLAAHTEDGVAVLPGTLEELAAHYVAEMRSLQPEGPYRLIGLSFGGVAAFEMAQQLRAAGQEVELLALVDSFISATWSRLPPHRIAVNLLKANPAGLIDWVKKRVKKVKANVRRTGYLPHIHYPWGVQKDLVEEYVPQPYEGEVVLFKAVIRAPGVFHRRNTPEEGWSKVIRHLDICEIPAGHVALLEDPHVHRLAEKIQSLLPTPPPHSPPAR